MRFIVIDEMHYFMESPRGIQLLCLMERLQRLTGKSPLRIELSATLGDVASRRNGSAAEAEQIARQLRQRAEASGQEDCYLVHHGDISASLCEDAEQKMKSASKPYAAIATVTLELGIDIGELERIVQVGTPYTLSSFAQLERDVREILYGDVNRVEFRCPKGICIPHKYNEYLPEELLETEYREDFLKCFS